MRKKRRATPSPLGAYSRLPASPHALKKSLHLFSHSGPSPYSTRVYPPSLEEVLHRECNEDTGSSKSNSVRGDLGSSALGTGAALSATVGSLVGAVDAGGRVGDFAGTNETLALDNAVVLELREGALEGLRGGLDVDAATDIADIGEGGIIECTGPVDRPANSRNLGEARDGGEISVVGDEEGSADGC